MAQQQRPVRTDFRLGEGTHLPRDFRPRRKAGQPVPDFQRPPRQQCRGAGRFFHHRSIKRRQVHLRGIFTEFHNAALPFHILLPVVDPQDVVALRAEPEHFPAVGPLRGIPQPESGRFDFRIVFHAEIDRPAVSLRFEDERTAVHVAVRPGRRPRFQADPRRLCGTVGAMNADRHQRLFAAVVGQWRRTFPFRNLQVKQSQRQQPVAALCDRTGPRL